VKKIRGDKPIGDIIHTYMEISQGNSLCSYLYLKLKCHIFHFIFPLFSPTESEIRRAEQVLPRGGGMAPLGRGGVGESG
jgi:hypothetical protein